MPNDEPTGHSTTGSPPPPAAGWANGPADPVTATLPVTGDGSLDLVGGPAGDAAYGDDVEPVDDLAELWPSRGPSNALRLRVPTAVLCALVIAAGAFWGGAALQKSHEPASGASAFSALARSFRSGTSRPSGAAAAFGAPTAAATGTVTAIQGSTVYVTNSAGNLVKVTIAATTTFTRDAKATAASLQPGDTVVVEGSTAKNGVVTASSVAATQAGVTAGFGRGG
jgi:Domain of unknown function (DUF5666)